MDKIAINQHQPRLASWGSVIAGAVSVIAVGLLLATLGTALGFTVIDPLSSDPLAGFGTAFGLWTAVIVVVSLAVGGYVAGRLAGRAGIIHGMLVWAVAFITAVAFGGMMMGAAVKTVGNVAGSTLSAVGSAAGELGSSLGGGIADMTQNLTRQLDKNLDVNVDRDRARNELMQLARDTGVKTLQPEYLGEQMDAAKGDVRTALRQLSNDPSDYEAIFKSLINKMKVRVDNITDKVDKEAAVNALAKNRNISHDDAERIVNNLIKRYQDGVAMLKDGLNNAQAQLDDAQKQVGEMVQEAREQADKAASAIAKSALMAFFALLIGALISSACGYYGVRCRYREDW